MYYVLSFSTYISLCLSSFLHLYFFLFVWLFACVLTHVFITVFMLVRVCVCVCKCFMFLRHVYASLLEVHNKLQKSHKYRMLLSRQTPANAVPRSQLGRASPRAGMGGLCPTEWTSAATVAGPELAKRGNQLFGSDKPPPSGCFTDVRDEQSPVSASNFPAPTDHRSPLAAFWGWFQNPRNHKRISQAPRRISLQQPRNK